MRMDEESNKECKEEGKKGFSSNPYNINKNPYSLLGDEEENEKRRQWQYGWEDAQREVERMDEVV